MTDHSEIENGNREFIFHHFQSMMSFRRAQYSESLLFFVKNLVFLSSGGIFLVATLLQKNFQGDDKAIFYNIIASFIISIALCIVSAFFAIYRNYIMFRNDSEYVQNYLLEGTQKNLNLHGSPKNESLFQRAIILLFLLFLLAAFCLFMYGAVITAYTVIES